MLLLNRNHPGFDLDLEVLATLRKWPAGVSLRELGWDFLPPRRAKAESRHHRTISRVITRLQAAGYAVGRSADSFAQAEAWIEIRGWHAARRAAQAYWDWLYGERKSEEPSVTAATTLNQGKTQWQKHRNEERTRRRCR